MRDTAATAYPSITLRTGIVLCIAYIVLRIAWFIAHSSGARGQGTGAGKKMQKSKCKMQNCGGPSGRLSFVGRSEKFFLDTDTLIGMILHEFL